MAFPDDPLDLVVEAYIGGQWRDLSDRLTDATVSITRGGRDGSTTAAASLGTLVLRDDDGALTPGNAMGQWYLGVRRGVPVRVHANGVARLTGSAVSYRPTLTPTTDGTLSATMQIQVAGPLRRLGQGQSPLRSALTRYLPTTGPIAWWPMEDGITSTQVASGVAGRPPMVVTAGAVEFSDDAPPGAAGSLSPTDDLVPLVGQVIDASLTGWTVSAWVRAVRDDPAEVCSYIFATAETTTGLTVTPYISITSSGTHHAGVNLYPPGYPDTGMATNIEGDATTVDGRWHLVQVTLTQSGANISASVYLDGALLTTGSRPSDTIGAPVRMRMQSAYQFQPTVVNLAEWGTSQTAVHNGIAPTAAMYAAGIGYAGETAGARLLRLATETGEDIQVIGDPAATMPMGPQRPASLLDLWQECADADGGLLHDGGVGVRYVTRVARYNRPPDLTINLGHPYGVRSGESSRVLAPVYDDQQLRNDVTATRTDGSSARVVDQDSIAADGRYDTELRVNVANDGLLPSIAGWGVHLGTVDEARWPQIPIDLAANPDLINAWLSCDIGARIARIGSLAPQSTLPDQVMAGYTETLGPRQWGVVAMCVPFSPWQVAEANGEPRVAAVGCTLSSTLLEATTTTFALASPATNGPWTTSPAHFPLDVRVGGERIRLSAISGTTTPQVATISARGLNGVRRAWPAGTPVDVWLPAIAPL